MHLQLQPGQGLLALGVALVFLSIAAVYRLLFSSRRPSDHDQFWASIPTVGVPRTGLLRWTRGAISAVTNSERLAADGYRRSFSNSAPDKTPHAHAFAIPSTGVGAIVVIPPSQMHRVLNAPVAEVAALPAQLDTLQPRYTIAVRDSSGRGIFDHDPAADDNDCEEDCDGERNSTARRSPIIQFDVVRRHLVRPADLAALAPITADELRAALVDCWGSQEQVSEWREVGLWESCTRVVARVANRVFLGLPLCRNEELLEQTRLYADAMYGGATLITALPRWARPVFGPLLAMPARRYLRNCNRVLLPVVRERMTMWDGGRGAGNCPDDALQWMIAQCSRAGPSYLDAGSITQRLLVLNLISIYTTTYGLANCIMDLLASPDRDDFLAGLRAECLEVSSSRFGSGGGFTTKEAIDELYRVDSAVRESLRTSAFGIVGLPRIVASPTGFALGGGIVVPQGTRLGVPLRAIHHDPAHYAEPERFDAFRFSRPFEGDASARRRHRQGQGQGESKGKPQGQKSTTEQLLSVETSETFLTYGLGKHACPGRWFASQMIKQALAYMLLDYDLELVGAPSGKITVLNMVLPPVSAKMRVRRRQG